MNKPIKEIKQILIEGNQRFLCNKPKNYDFKLQRQRLIKAQDPFVIIIGCADSRVPPEIIFDCGLGDIFDLRVAGNIIDEDIIESIQYAIHEFNCNLVIVLGHTECGAIKMSIEHDDNNDIIDKIQYVIDNIDQGLMTDDEYYNKIIDANIKNSINILKQKLNVTIEGAKYYIESGKVKWLR